MVGPARRLKVRWMSEETAAHRKYSRIKVGPLSVSLLGLLILQCFTYFVHRGPRPLSDDAPADVFSAERGVRVLQRLLGDELPHPAESEANRQVLDRLVAELRGLGLEVQVLEENREARPMTLRNVLARLPGGDEARRPLVLATHYDSVDKGPGAGDAGASLAALLETARILRQLPSPARPVYFLFSDGEELGMLGAREFTAHHPLSRRSPWLLNFDGRGASGPSLMYETHEDNVRWVQFCANRLAAPRVTGSSFVTIYRLLPNNSDFTIYRQNGWQGLNFAFIGDAHRYHQPSDRIENLSRRTVQHHGAHATALARALGWTEIDDLSAEQDAIFFDLLGQYVVVYPASWGAPLAWLTTVVIVWQWLRYFRRSRAWGGIGWTTLAALAAIITSAAVCWLICWGLTAAGVLQGRFVSSGWLIHWTYAGVAALCLWGVLGILRRTGAEPVWHSIALGWAAVHLGVAIFLPGMSYLFLAPCLACAVLSLTPWDRRWTAAIATIVSGSVLLPTMNLLAAAFGPSYGLALGMIFAAVLTPVFPMLGREERRT